MGSSADFRSSNVFGILCFCHDSWLLGKMCIRDRDLKVPGREAKNIFFAVDFLSMVTKSLLDSEFQDQKCDFVRGKDVVVIGGGDTGNDCVGTSIRLGAKSVVQLEMMPKAPDSRTPNNPWPEWPRICKTDYGQEEAIAVFGHDPRIYQTTVTEFIKDEAGNVQKDVYKRQLFSSITCHRLEPMGKVCCSIFYAPFFHCYGDRICNV